MNKNLLNWIALRYFKSKKRTGLISFTSYVSIIGIALGSFALLVTLSVLNGFESEITSRVINLESHIRITGKGISSEDIKLFKDILKEEEIKDIHPFVNRKSILSTFGNDAVVRIKAIDSLNLSSQLSHTSSILRGTNTFSVPLSNLPGILVGCHLADKLALYIGDTLNVINPLNVGAAFNIPYVGKFVLSGIFQLDLFDYDDNLAFIELKEGQRIFEQGDFYSGVDIKFEQYRDIDSIKEKIALSLGEGFHILSWEDLHKTLFGAMKLEKYGSFVALCFIILVAIFNLMSSLVMLVMEKIREIGMLQALGMNQKHIKSIFLRLGMITGSLGLIIGLIISLILCLLQSAYRFIPLPPVYFIPYLPVEVHFLDIVYILLAGTILIFLGTTYPSWRVGKLMPLEAIQYEK